jgi:hypothetical protein
MRTVNEQTYAAWGDDRRSIHAPENKFDPLSDQTHPQGDVFFSRRDARFVRLSVAHAGAGLHASPGIHLMTIHVDQRR